MIYATSAYHQYHKAEEADIMLGVLSIIAWGLHHKVVFTNGNNRRIKSIEGVFKSLDKYGCLFVKTNSEKYIEELMKNLTQLIRYNNNNKKRKEFIIRKAS